MSTRPVTRVVTPAAEHAARARAIADLVLAVPGVAALTAGHGWAISTAAPDGPGDGVRIDHGGIHIALTAERHAHLPDLARAVRSVVHTVGGPAVNVEIADITDTPTEE